MIDRRRTLLSTTEIAEIAVAGPADGPYGVTVAGGEVWTTLVHSGRLATASGRVFDLGAPASRPSVVVAGPDDAVWFTRNGDGRVGRLGYDGALSSYEVGGAPYGLCVGPDGALWTTLMDSDSVARVGIDGAVTTYPIGVAGAFPAMITTFAGDLWFTMNQANAIGRMTVAGEVTSYPLPTPSSGPVGIGSGPDGIWFVEILSSQAGRITAEGKVEEFPLPADSKPHAVAPLPDGGCWTTLWATGSLVRLDAAGNLVEEHALGNDSEPHGLALDTDGTVWVALENGNLKHVG
jgi:virginiamycin B lyase